MLPETLGPIVYDAIYSTYQLASELSVYGLEVVSPYCLWLVTEAVVFIEMIAPLDQIVHVFSWAFGINALSYLTPNNYSLAQDLEEAYYNIISPYLPKFIKGPLEAIATVLYASTMLDFIRFGIGCASIYFFPYAFLYSVSMNLSGYLLSCFTFKCIDTQGLFEKDKHALLSYAKQAAGLASIMATLSSLFIGDFFAVVPLALLAASIFTTIQFTRHNTVVQNLSNLAPEENLTNCNKDNQVAKNHWLVDSFIRTGYQSIYFVTVVLYKSLSVMALIEPMKYVIEHNAGPLEKGLEPWVERVQHGLGDFTENYIISPIATIASHL